MLRTPRLFKYPRMVPSTVPVPPDTMCQVSLRNTKHEVVFSTAQYPLVPRLTSESGETTGREIIYCWTALREMGCPCGHIPTTAARPGQ